MPVLITKFGFKGFAIPKEAQGKEVKFSFHGQPAELKHGSVVVSILLDRYGCMTCIGNSGDIYESVASVITDNDIVAAAVLSGSRNFEGRVHPLTRANYFASPPFVVAYALVGTVLPFYLLRVNLLSSSYW